MSDAAIGLLGVVLGAVIAGVTTRSTELRRLDVETDRFWSTRLHDAAAALIRSYTLDRTTLRVARQLGREKPSDDGDFATDLRRDAQARLMTLPRGRELRGEAHQLSLALDGLIESYESSEDAWLSALPRQDAAIRNFQLKAAELVRGSRRVSRTGWLAGGLAADQAASGEEE